VKRASTISLLATLAGRYLDIATTYIIIYSGLGYEANPHMRPYVHDPPTLLAIQTLGGLAMWAILYFASKVVGGRIQRALAWLAVALSWSPVLNNLLTPLGFSPLAALYVR
jgi:hypothetical protein